MAFSLKKRVQSKSHVASGGDDDANALGEILHRSTKTKNKKNKKNQLLYPDHQQVHLLDSDVEINTRSSLIYRSECPCDKHYQKQLVERNYHLTVDKLFDLIFGSNEFVRTYRQAQRFYDDTATEWIINESTNHRERTLKYKVPYESTFIGKSTILTREKQTLLHEVPGSNYVLETEVLNEGVKFCDTFSLTIRYCLVQTSLTTTHLRVTAQIYYNKSVNSFVKQLIERNAYSASYEGLKDLNNCLDLITNFKMEKQRSSKHEITLTVPTNTCMDQENALTVIPSYQSMSDYNKPSQSFVTNQSTFILIFLIAALVCIQIYLHMKLNHMAFLVNNLAHSLKI